MLVAASILYSTLRDTWAEEAEDGSRNHPEKTVTTGRGILCTVVIMIKCQFEFKLKWKSKEEVPCCRIRLLEMGIKSVMQEVHNIII